MLPCLCTKSIGRILLKLYQGADCFVFLFFFPGLEIDICVFVMEMAGPTKKVISLLLKLEIPYDQVCLLVGWSIGLSRARSFTSMLLLKHLLNWEQIAVDKKRTYLHWQIQKIICMQFKKILTIFRRHS